MKIHLFRSEEVSVGRFRTIFELISQFKGPIKFIALKTDIEESSEELDACSDSPADHPDPDAVPKRPLHTLLWSEVYSKCHDLRAKYQIKDDESVVLLSDHPNEQNWFSHWDPSGRRNFYVHTDYWKLFVEADSWFPIVYEIATIPFGIVLFRNLDELVEAAHEDPRGCTLDYCKNKRQVELRLRTADICSDCYKLMIAKKVDPAIASQIFAIWEGMRSNILYRNRFSILQKVSKIEIDVAKRLIYFKDIGNLSIRFSPLEITFYLFFLKHKGVYLKDLTGYKKEILELYKLFSSTAEITELNHKIEIHTCYNSNPLSGVLNSIKGKIEMIVGLEMASHYIISGSKGEKREVTLSDDLYSIIPKFDAHGRVRTWMSEKY